MEALATGPDAVLWHDVRMSATRVLAGFALSAVVGVPFGLVMGVSPVVRAALNPVISIIRPLPALSWIPLSMLWLGIDEQQKYAIVFMGSFASVLVYTTDATMRVDNTLVLAARNLGGDATPEEDALVCGDDASAKASVLELAAKLTSGRAIDCGPLASARALEGLTAVIVNVNKRYRAHAGRHTTECR